MKRIVICADDYGIAPGVSEAIRALLAERRINATSVMTVLPDLFQEADLLLPMTGGQASIGLHITLTGNFEPLTHGFKGKTFPSLGKLMALSFARRLDPVNVKAEVETQFLAFEEAFGRPPDHVDGHQHVHLLPVIREAVIETTRRRAPQAWVRDCTPASDALQGLDPKGRFIGFLARGFAEQAKAAGLATNRGFAGAYNFKMGTNFGRVLTHFLNGLEDGGLVMVHPGLVDDALVKRDPLTRPREAEYEVLAGAQLPQILLATGAQLR
ncbi:hypothetical protein GCM10007301_48590 [Azorhizobium oxalatiphilum]|uniref:ChbG/HpnK family deacetylase n=1 Tax=Azorhizobium oxalatiphilum TaxID=980631 RepID=A0A917CC99_9HYPH|nr:ChbG/HpnK family deacetylase [Azorhizobium oxalatiphilum]GGF82753.1 hypothetical protein GCM10007301_48590 [Azorhizobium oxalatiphilum]